MIHDADDWSDIAAERLDRIDALNDELARLRRWKAEATAVLTPRKADR